MQSLRRTPRVLLTAFFLAGTPEICGTEQLLERFGTSKVSDGTTVTAGEVVGFVRQLAEVSPRVRVETFGLSTDGRPLVAAFVSTPENLATLTNATGSFGKPVILVTAGIHADEVGATLSTLPLLHRLAEDSSEGLRRVREELIVCVIPCLNPDGQEQVAGWLRSTHARGVRRLPFLYQRFVGHDLNRDWLLGTQAEARSTIQGIHNRFRPWVTIDLHQMGVYGPRVFLPPYADPVDPAISPALTRYTERLGVKVADRLLDLGVRGIAWRWHFDAWSPSRAYSFYHGGARFLIEVASARYSEAVEVAVGALHVFAGNRSTATHPRPWEGGRWGLPEIVDTFLKSVESTLEAIAVDSGSALRALRERDEKSVSTVVRLDTRRADQSVVMELLDSLLLGGAEISRDRAGESWWVQDPAWGSGWARALLTCSEYPSAAGAPYDTSSHDLAQLAGLKAVVESREQIVADTGGAAPKGATQATAGLPPGASPRVRIVERRGLRVEGEVRCGPEGRSGMRRWILRQDALGIFRALADLVEADVRIDRLSESWWPPGDDAPREAFAPGDFILSRVTFECIETLRRRGVDAWCLPAEGAGPDAALPTFPFVYPDIVVLQGPRPSEDEGWLRWFLEDQRVRFRAVRLSALESLIPKASTTIVLLAEDVPSRVPPPVAGRLAVFVRAGGRVIALGSAAQWCVRRAVLPLTRASLDGTHLPGTLLRARRVTLEPAALDPLLWGYRQLPNLFYKNGPVWSESAQQNVDKAAGWGIEAVLGFDVTAARACGILEEATRAKLESGVAMVRVRPPEGDGTWVLMGFRPHFRAWTKDTFRLLLNAIYSPL